MRVYVTQFGGWWSMSLQEWADLCKSVLDTGGYDLSGYRELKRRPSGVGIEHWRDAEGHPSVSYYAPVRGQPFCLFFKPLDWEREQWEHERMCALASLADIFGAGA